MIEYAKLHCSFCSKNASEVKKLIAGPDVYICNECVAKCHTILTEPASAKKEDTKAVEDTKNATGDKMLCPREIKDFLDEYVVGQDHAKEVLSVAVYNHYKRLEHPVIDGVEIEKSNILMCGPTGVGKTLLAQTIARLLDVPFAIADATSLTEAGYVGEDVENVVGRLLASANGDIARCERGIIFLDEIDKKRSGGGGTAGRDVSGEGVQQALLKLLEDSEVLVAPVGVKKMPSTELVRIKTRNILFIVGGAFVGLDKLVEKSMRKGQSAMGYTASSVGREKLSTNELLTKVEPDHLEQFGLIPELIGRLPVIAALSDLDEPQLVRVLTEPKNALLKQTAAMFRLDGVELEFEPEALLAIAKIAKARKTNGRALRSVIESRLLRTQFRLPDLRTDGVTKIVVSARHIVEQSEPDLHYATPPAADLTPPVPSLPAEPDAA